MLTSGSTPTTCVGVAVAPTVEVAGGVVVGTRGVDVLVAGTRVDVGDGVPVSTTTVEVLVAVTGTVGVR